MFRNPIVTVSPKFTTRIIAAALAFVIGIGIYRVFFTEADASTQPPGSTDDGNGTPAEDIDTSGQEDESEDEVDKDDSDTIYNDKNAEVLGNQISSQAAILCNNAKNTVIAKKSEHSYITSATVLSLSVALTVMDALSTGEITANDRAVCPASSVRLPCYKDTSAILSVGQSLTVAELIKCMFCAQPELFAYTLAIHVAGGEMNFVNRMNTLLYDIGIRDTVFRSVSDPSLQNTTVTDAAVIFRSAMENPSLKSLLTTAMTFTVSASGSAWSTVTLCNRFYSECCTEGQARADGIIGGYFSETGGKQFVFMLFDQGGSEHIAITVGSETAYADALILLARSVR
ncbi:MAG: hypothetical protein IKB34_07275 [Clostridia bacterium]|nr:hypothetical protein [Clostridia bacterium]